METVYKGKNVRNMSERLDKVRLEDLHNSIKNPDNETLALIRQLRAVKDLDSKRFQQLKTQLPFFMCATYNPQVRKKENFAYIDHFIVDIDNLDEKGLTADDIRKKAKKDSRVVLAFESAGQDGIKLVFRLKDKCYDTGIFELFHNAFTKGLAKKYKVTQVPDKWSSMVTQACFLSADTEAYYNSKAECVCIDDYLNREDSSSLFNMKHCIDKDQKGKKKTDGHEESHEPSSKIMDKIRKMLNFRKKQKSGHPVFVPEELERIMEGLRTFIIDHEIEVDEIVNIQYGKKIRCHIEEKKAEMNLFYGKKGFSAVLSPRTGTDAELNQILVELVNAYIEDYNK